MLRPSALQSGSSARGTPGRDASSTTRAGPESTGSTSIDPPSQLVVYASHFPSGDQLAVIPGPPRRTGSSHVPSGLRRTIQMPPPPDGVYSWKAIIEPSGDQAPTASCRG